MFNSQLINAAALPSSALIKSQTFHNYQATLFSQTATSTLLSFHFYTNCDNILVRQFTKQVEKYEL